ncbi:MAG TPA: hypothetical protein P5194_01140 [Patescibacteria group bacterium]|nr:hypothetical protein [bacterium]HRT11133.1 hypothetical protein [Patescibacteria group bacterium]HRU89972.1 hypothetical protein [Patescibacteria group bacterium]
MINYKNILKQTWQITIKNRWLWVMGLFAALLSNVNQYTSLLNAFDGSGWSRFLNSLSVYWNYGLSLINISSHNPLLLLLCLLALVLIIGLLFLAVNSQIVLVQKIQHSIKSEGKKSLPLPRVSFWQQIKNNWPIFWPTVGIIVTVKLILLFGLLIISLGMTGAYLIRQPIISVFVYIVLVLLFLVLIWLIGTWGFYWLLLFLSDKKSDWLASAKEAWHILCENLLASLGIFIIVVLINLVVYLLWIFIMGLLAIPYSLLSLLLIRYLSFSEVPLIIIAQILLIAGLMFVVGIVTVFEYSLWLSFIDKLPNKSNKNIIRRVSHAFHRQ